jgi:hypothetical protein
LRCASSHEKSIVDIDGIWDQENSGPEAGMRIANVESGAFSSISGNLSAAGVGQFALFICNMKMSNIVTYCHTAIQS